jgi:hypothetical protein
VVPLPGADKGKPTNRLAKESSPYLLQHAHNPVDWHPWGEEAFAKARKEGKLVFLSIGYSSCHWCHVMEKESFADDEVAKLLNKWFVCIKVDREERPDVDHIYMTALHAMGGRGGWPLSMFLTADGKPFFGGTYWPREDRTVDGATYRGFKSIVKVIQEIHDKEPDKIREQAGQLAARTQEVLASAARGSVLVELNRELVTGVVEALKEEFDAVHGGFGSPQNRFRGPKFPTPPYLGLLEYEAARASSEEVEHMLKVTLDRMARGGICDQVGGGFHRYSTERTWTVPHFEKMLYDNAQLAEVYARAYRRTKNPFYRRVVREMLAFVARELTSPEGGFYSALDADSEEEEGRFYVWTAKELDAVLTDKAEADLVRKVYGAEAEPNFEDKYHILVLTKPLPERAKELELTEQQLEQRLNAARKKLFDTRAKRPRPFLDTKVLAGWNGQMIAGYAVAGQCLEEPKYLETSAKAADFVLGKLRTRDGRLLRSYAARPGAAAEARLNAYLDDYAYLVHGLLCLHDATKTQKWLDEAKALTETMIKLHADKDGGFFYTSHDHEKLFARSKDQYDGAQPAGNSVAARNLVRLWQKTGEERYRDLAEKTLRAFAGALKSNPTALTTMAEALALHLDLRAKETPKK